MSVTEFSFPQAHSVSSSVFWQTYQDVAIAKGFQLNTCIPIISLNPNNKKTARMMRLGNHANGSSAAYPLPCCATSNLYSKFPPLSATIS
jgi:hypothetical protein